MSDRTWSARKRRVDVDGVGMAYVEEGAGDPIVLLHGNPTSSYLWRNVIPHLVPLGRCIAPDLVGMGDSDPLLAPGPGRYRFVEHRRYLDGLLEAIGATEQVTFVVHDWGSALGFDWADRHRGQVAGIAYMEAIVRPLTWAEWPEAARPVFQGFRSEAGESMVLERNVFLEEVLPGLLLRRRPMLTWVREVPIDGEPADVDAIVRSYAEWLSAAPVPKLFVNADPGALLTGPQREFCQAWPNQVEVTVRG